MTREGMPNSANNMCNMMDRSRHFAALVVTIISPNSQEEFDHACP